MYPVEHYLKQLLLEFDCVTVPGLGGFILHPKPATINRAKNRILPPSRRVAFNSLLTHDDGLLTTAVAKGNDVSYRDASAIVAEYVNSCKNRLNAGFVFQIEGIGEISGPFGQMLFKQTVTDHFNNEVFGMEAVSLRHAANLPATARTENVRIDRKPARINDRKPASVRWTIAVSIPVILFLLYGIIFPQNIRTIYMQYSGMRPGIPATEHVEITMPVQQAVEEIKTAQPAAIPPANLTQAEEKPIQVSLPVQKYYVIGGCFESEENAEKFFSVLASRGFSAEKAGKTNRGHIRISYGSFMEKDQALQYLSRIRNEENPSAWLLKY